MDKPVLSILIPTYNRIFFLKKTLNSIFDQNFEELFEVIVVDDGSEDGTWEYLTSLQKTRNNLKIAKHEKNQGVASARNTALSLSKGEYIFFLDSDDYLLENTLAKIFETLETKKEVYLWGVYIEKEKKRKLKRFPPLSENPLQRLKSFIDGKYAEALYIIKSSFFEGFQFNPQLKVREDWVLKAKIIALNSVEIINQPLGVKRDHPERLRYKVEFYEENLLFSIELLFRELPSQFQELYSYAKAKAYFELASKYLQAKKPDKALENLKKALECEPSLKRDLKFFKKIIKAFLFKAFQGKDV